MFRHILFKKITSAAVRSVAEVFFLLCASNKAYYQAQHAHSSLETAFSYLIYIPLHESEEIATMRHIRFIAAIIIITLCGCRGKTDNVDALPFSTGEEDGWGLLAISGKELTPTGTYATCPTAVINKMFSVTDEEGNRQLYHIDRPLQPVTPQTYTRIGHFFEEVAPAQETPHSPILLIDRKGRVIVSTDNYPHYDIILMHNFREGRALIATRKGKYGYMDTQGQVIIPPLYDVAHDFSDGCAIVGMANREGCIAYQVIDKEGKVLQTIQTSNCQVDKQFKDGLLLLYNPGNHRFSYLNRQGETAILLPKEVTIADAFEQGYATFKTASGYGLLSKKGEVLIAPGYEKIHVVSPNRVAVQTGKRWALAESNGKLLTKFAYDTIGTYYHNGWAVARTNGQYLWIDRNGHELAAPTRHSIVEDPAAQGKVPQLFIRQEEEKAEATLSDKEGNGTYDKEPATTKKERTPHPTATDGGEPTPPRTTIDPDSWKNISRQSPFYEEACKVLSGKLQVEDSRNRRMILNYVEHLRTSYTTKDIDFLEQLFSENALIVVGTVIRTAPYMENNYLPAPQVVYNVKSKRQYLERLRQVFKANKEIRLNFSGFHIMRHPTQQGIYGVSLRQEYASDIYHDDGYLFLLWDFRDEAAPKIHVRTWQPGKLDDNTPLPESEVFNISNFHLE